MGGGFPLQPGSEDEEADLVGGDSASLSYPAELWAEVARENFENNISGRSGGR